MTRPLLTVFGLLAGCIAAMPTSAQEIHYLGRIEGAEEQALIQLRGQHFTVGEGDEIPGMGIVHEVTDYALIVRRTLTEYDKQQLRAAGHAVYDVEERHIGTLLLRLVPRQGQ